jgi:hypothetical protein
MSLQTGDLKHMVSKVFEIDSYASKMGDDKNIVTLSFSVKDKQPAEDLANFLEKGYSFILDADVTAGEQSDGTYKVFVEIQRERGVHDNINELIDGVGKLADIDSFKFRYYKDFRSKDATLEEFQSNIPDDPENYGIIATEANMNNFKNFFNRSYVDQITMNENDIITIGKKYAEPLNFKFIDIGEKDDILNNINESLNFNDFAEVIFLSKYVGDYNITKYGNKLTFENAGKTLVVERL